MLELKKHIWSEIDLDAIKENLSAFSKLAKDSEVIAVIKANAYGHGAHETAEFLTSIGVSRFAVASVREAMELRAHGIDGSILILGYTAPEDIPLLADNGISQSVYSEAYAAALAERLTESDKKLNIHIKLNTGMNRLGFNCTTDERAAEKIAKILQLPCFAFEGIFTHFASADKSGDPDLSFSEIQGKRFLKVCRKLKSLGYTPKLRHCCNSAGIVTMPHLHLDAVRLGISLYGLTPDVDLELPVKLHPALCLKSTITMVQEIDENQSVSYGRTFNATSKMKIATVPVGYADGYPRLLSGKGEVLISGKRCKVLGRVCMDQLIVDVSSISDICEGDEVVLIGKQGAEFISAEEIASLCGTINYEIVCGISRRVPRYYIKNGKIQSVTDYLYEVN